jgi:hypothetical protein
MKSMKPTKHILLALMLAALTLLTTGPTSADDLVSESRPSVVIVDKGMARSFTTDNLHSGIYAFTFDQQGLMAGLGLQGSKIMRID